MHCKPYLLRNKVQHYLWGSSGEHAFIPSLLELDVEPKKPYAELWMGAHPKAPSEVEINKGWIPLDRLVRQYPTEILGERLGHQFNGQWPFLFKVLSANEPLSIQTHPNKSQAEELHLNDPEHYPDANHKPEIAIALDRLTALVGFRPFREIQNTITVHKEISEFIGKANTEKAKTVQHLYEAMVTRWQNDPSRYEQSCHNMAERLRIKKDEIGESEQLYLQMIDKYPDDDIGLFTIFFLNILHFEKGEGIFLRPGIPHAYIQGNIIECMANSDNVVRLGLTPKFKDVTTLLKILSYQTDPILAIKGDPEAEAFIYPADVSEFSVARRTIQSGQSIQDDASQDPSILLVTEGEMTFHWVVGEKEDTLSLKRGQSCLLPACLRQYRIASKRGCTLYKAGVPPK